eukprot:CAMPEP_0196664826 /NCGR_PEP_ID=MMETSP1086-20130531/58577_1 /TAXON_ID=77921 /ORGANISM="Cyanoptyche  gloeocystis , Strain SAG4.97" /LENGTH=33 /DNA_ID= /DNA_START= /DNA_END= /DNA_ORIENTATION=
MCLKAAGEPRAGKPNLTSSSQQHAATLPGIQPD